MRLIKKLSKAVSQAIRKHLVGWIPLGVAITGISGLTYVAVQQNFRMTANDPQIQIAEDVTDALNSGTSPQNIVPPVGQMDMAKSLDPFVIIYKDNGDVIGTSAQLDSQTPKLDQAILNLTKKKGELRFTWEPKKGVRLAVVVRSYNGGFVLAGRSLREIEKREDDLTLLVAVLWLFTMTGSFASKAILASFTEKKR